MATARGITNLSRPSHLTSTDWNDPDYRTGVASCLVEGVYKMEVERQNNRMGLESQAHLWWEMFNFTLHETLINKSDSSIYGAIFEYNLSYRYYNSPRYLIAFRGTIIKPETWFCDLRLDFRCGFDSLHRCIRFEHAMQSIRAIVAKHSNSSVWLAGHSLGAGLALLAGKSMAKSGFLLETYIFNPPIASIPLEKLIHSKVIKGGIRVAGSLLKAGVASIFKDLEGQEEDPSMNIASWTPYLYVNSKDPICSEYIGYFKNKTFMTKIGLSKIEKIATKNPLRSLFIGHGVTLSPLSNFSSTEPLHLLPSAYMSVNTKESHKCLRQAHGLKQWWDPSYSCEYVLYEFKR